MEFIERGRMKKLAENFEGDFFYIKSEDFPQFFDNFPDEFQEVAYKIKENETGAVLMQGEKNLLVIPPFPVEKTFRGNSSHIVEMLDKKLTLGIILLRLGEYSLGVFRGNELVAHKTGTQFVSGQTRAGGQSAARYGRIREGQMNDFFKSVCIRVKEKILPLRPEYIFFGGDSQTVKAFMKKCECLEKFRVMGRTLNVRHMKMENLKSSLREVWKFRVYEISRI